MNLLVKFKGYLATAVLFAVGLLAAYLSGKSTAEQKAESDNKDKEVADTKAVAEAQVTSTTAAKKVIERVNRDGDSAVDDELSNRFTRD